ncbi:MAG: hypothetical protein CMO01_05190 [Thalassobius sp.]|nr:hypothetical protein [Thalassovita sp.]
MNDRKLNPLTVGAVEEAALFLAKEKGHVTTLDIKEYLRSEGYFAMQSDVSEFMKQLAIVDCEWSYFFTGSYRIYFNMQFAFQYDIGIVSSLN